MYVRPWIWRVLASLSLLAFLAWPTLAYADGEVILHVSDTHVAPGDNGHWNAFANMVVDNADGIAAVVHSGDATNDPTSSAFFTEALLPPWNRILSATHGVMALGNHDVDAPWSWYRQGLAQYARTDTSTHAFIAYDFMNGNWQVIEEMVAQAAREGKRVTLVSHQPTLVPPWVTCDGGTCVSPAHLLSDSKAANLRRIIGTYDVEVLFAGHIHATYQMRDRTPGYDLIVPGNLGSNAMPGKYYSTVFLGEHITSQPTVWSDLPAVFRSPPYFDALSNSGWTLNPTPIQLQIVGHNHASKVESVCVDCAGVAAYVRGATGGLGDALRLEPASRPRHCESGSQGYLSGWEDPHGDHAGSRADIVPEPCAPRGYFVGDGHRYRCAGKDFDQR